ncbi:MAG: glycerophosphodiester phosphodiesterase [Tannerella sp.]|jgi:glycerophosphoryl diester phosphodiesterase|nr:glycerophosphodiester phosphodiesterase [Tannerella sp.]
MKKILFIVLTSLCLNIGLSIRLVAQNWPQVIAHRGYWQTGGSAQNTIASLENAERIKVYGSEFDVRMTKDSVLVIIHDAEIDSIKVEESPYAAIQDIILSNGERIPTLREYLEAGKNLVHAKLILELKIAKKNDPAWSREAARRTVNIVREKRVQMGTEYITFDLEAGKELIRLAPESPVYYLNGELAPKELKALGFAGLDYHIDVMMANKQWFKEAKALGLGVNVWTVNDLEQLRELMELGADYITTDIPSEAIRFIMRNF